MTGLYQDVYQDTYGAAMTAHPGVWIYVWKDPPDDHALDHYQGALVRAANGNGTKAPEGFDFAANYDKWVAKFGASRVSPWTYLYPSSTGATAARAVFGSAGTQPWYQIDLEEAVPPATIRDFCDTLHNLAPGCKLIFDSYPTRAQFINVNGATGAATWDQAVKSFDGFCPQVYHLSQKDDGWEGEFAGKFITPAFSPANWADWAYFQRNLDRFGSVKLWRYTMTNNWQGKLQFTQGEDMPLTSDDVQKVADAVVAKLSGPAFMGKRWDPDSPGALTLTELLGKFEATSLYKQLDAILAAVAAVKAGVPVTLTPEQLDDLKAVLSTLPSLEGSAMVNLVISPPRP